MLYVITSKDINKFFLSKPTTEVLHAFLAFKVNFFFDQIIEYSIRLRCEVTDEMTMVNREDSIVRTSVTGVDVTH